MFRNDRVSVILLKKWVSATAAEFESHLPNAVTPSSKPWPQATFGLIAQWPRSHSPMKRSEYSFESCISVLKAIRRHNSICGTFRTFSKVLLLLTQYPDSIVLVEYKYTSCMPQKITINLLHLSV